MATPSYVPRGGPRPRRAAPPARPAPPATNWPMPPAPTGPPPVGAVPPPTSGQPPPATNGPVPPFRSSPLPAMPIGTPATQPGFKPGRAMPPGTYPSPGRTMPAGPGGLRPQMPGLAPGGGYGPSERRPGARPQWGGGRRYNPGQYQPPAQWGGRAPQLNRQQQQMRMMPQGMRQAYNNRPMTQQSPGIQPMAPPTQRGKPAASRVNLQGNQLNRFRY